MHLETLQDSYLRLPTHSCSCVDGFYRVRTPLLFEKGSIRLAISSKSQSLVTFERRVVPLAQSWSKGKGFTMQRSRVYRVFPGCVETSAWCTAATSSTTGRSLRTTFSRYIKPTDGCLRKQATKVRMTDAKLDPVTRDKTMPLRNGGSNIPLLSSSGIYHNSHIPCKAGLSKLPTDRHMFVPPS